MVLRKSIRFEGQSLSYTQPHYENSWVKVGYKDEILLAENIRAMISELRNDLNVTSQQLANLLKIILISVDKNMKYLKDNGYIERVGNKRTEYLKAID